MIFSRLSTKHSQQIPYIECNDADAPEGVLLGWMAADSKIHVEIKEKGRMIYFNLGSEYYGDDSCFILSPFTEEYHVICPKGTVAVFTQNP